MGWQMTLKGIICERVGKETTIFVYPDGRTACAFIHRFGVNKECPGPESCPTVTEYRDQILGEEAKAERAEKV